MIRMCAVCAEQNVTSETGTCKRRHCATRNAGSAESCAGAIEGSPCRRLAARVALVAERNGNLLWHEISTHSIASVCVVELPARSCMPHEAMEQASRGGPQYVDAKRA